MEPARACSRILPVPLASMPLLSASEPLVTVMFPVLERRTIFPLVLVVRSERALVIAAFVLVPLTRLMSKVTPVTLTSFVSVTNILPPPLDAARVAIVVSMAFAPVPMPVPAVSIRALAVMSTSMSPLASPSTMSPVVA